MTFTRTQQPIRSDTGKKRFWTFLTFIYIYFTKSMIYNSAIDYDYNEWPCSCLVSCWQSFTFILQSRKNVFLGRHGVFSCSTMSGHWGKKKENLSAALLSVWNAILVMQPRCRLQMVKQRLLIKTMLFYVRTVDQHLSFNHKAKTKQGPPAPPPSPHPSDNPACWITN